MKGSNNMEKEKWFGIIQTRRNEIDELKLVIKSKEKEIVEAHNKIAEELTSEYSDLVGKKVRITWRKLYAKTDSIVEGYFKGFAYTYTSWKDLDGIYPVVMKIRKDGSESKVDYTHYDLPKYTPDWNTTIEPL